MSHHSEAIGSGGTSSFISLLVHLIYVFLGRLFRVPGTFSRNGGAGIESSLVVSVSHWRYVDWFATTQVFVYIPEDLKLEEIEAEIVQCTLLTLILDRMVSTVVESKRCCRAPTAHGPPRLQGVEATIPFRHSEGRRRLSVAPRRT